jgi:TrmH family RNA methyltransferase
VANGKLLRATAGSIFRVPFLEEISRTDLVAETRRRNLPLYALMPKGELTVTQADFRQPCVLAVGSEGGGISSEILANARTVTVPMAKVESLNAAVACSIALFEAARQRRKA